MPIVESVVEKQGKNGTFWIAVIDGKEVMAFNKEIFDLKGKELPYPIGTSQSGKAYVQFPKAGGFQKGGAGGGWKGKSDKEIYGQILGTCMSYAKDKYIAEIPLHDVIPENTDERIVETYRVFSKALLADLAKLVPDAPKPTEASKTETKAPEKPPQETSPPRTGTDKEAKTVKEKLEKKMWQLLANQHADNDQNFKALLIELTEFVGKDGKKVFVDNFEKLSDKWAGSCMGKLETLIEEEERKNMANAPGMEDIKY